MEAFLYQTWADLAMSNYPPSVSPILSSCSAMINASSNMTDGLSAIGALLEPFWNQSQCLNLSDQTPGPQGTIHCSDLTGCGPGLDGKSWDYQACQQNISPMATHGGATSSNPDFNGKDMFAPNWIWNMTWLSEHCDKTFNLNINSIYNRQHWMRNSFGLFDTYWNNNFEYTTSNIIFSNGMQDGWHAGGQLTNFTNSDSIVAILMENAAHHCDLSSASPLDTDDVKQAREMETKLLTKWVQDARMKRKQRKQNF